MLNWWRGATIARQSAVQRQTIIIMGATSQEEIANQHQTAIKIIQNNKPCISRINHGEVPLSRKLQPTCTLNVDGVDDNGESGRGKEGEEGEEEERGIEVVNVDYPTWCVSSRKLLITFDVLFCQFLLQSSPFITIFYTCLSFRHYRRASGRVTNSQTNN